MNTEHSRNEEGATSQARDSILMSLSFVMNVAGKRDALALANGSDLSEEEISRELDAVGASLCPPPNQVWGQLEERVDMVPVPGTDPADYEAVVPIWTDRGMATRGIRVRFFHTGFEDVYWQRVVGFEDVTPPPDWASLPPDPLTPPAPRDPKPPPEENPVPQRWRGPIRDVVHRLVTGDYEGLQRDGIVSDIGDPRRDMVKTWIDDYPDRLVDLPEAAWAWSGHVPPYAGPDVYSVWLHMWTEHEGLSDLILEGEIYDNGDDDIRVVVNTVHVA